MTKTVGVHCPWFYDGTMKHNLEVLGNATTLEINTGQQGSVVIYDIGDDVIEMHFNSKEQNYNYYVDLVPFSDASGGYPPEKRILGICEPSCFLPKTDEWLDKVSKYYPNYVLAWSGRVATLPQARYWNPSNIWVTPGNTKKQFGVSGVFSFKYQDDIPGYVLRRHVMKHQDDIKVPSTIYNFTTFWLGKPVAYPLKSKDQAMDVMFHLALENCIEPGWFSEKILDCFASFTVPLYFGDPEIGKHFDTNGIIIVNQDNIIDRINSLTEDDYHSRLKAMENNFEKSRSWWSMPKTLAQIVKELPNA